MASSCSKSNNYVAPAAPPATAPSAGGSTTPVTSTPVVDTPVNPLAGYTVYRIRKGQNYCDGNSYPAQTVKAVKFSVVFDSSCIYTNADPQNQADINKLWGFADSGTFHQVNSARIGWNWMDGKMHIHAYCYVHGERQYRELGTVPLNAPQTCAITVLPGKYVFTLNGKSETVSRGSMEDQARGYTLYPYFGGDEPAPKDISIRIRLM